MNLNVNVYCDLNYSFSLNFFHILLTIDYLNRSGSIFFFYRFGNYAADHGRRMVNQWVSGIMKLGSE